MGQMFGAAEAEDSLYGTASMRPFVGFPGVTEGLPDDSVNLKFRRSQEKHALTAKLLDEMNEHLEAQGLLMLKGTRQSMRRVQTRLAPTGDPLGSGEQWQPPRPVVCGAVQRPGGAGQFHLPRARLMVV